MRSAVSYIKHLMGVQVVTKLCEQIQALVTTATSIYEHQQRLLMFYHTLIKTFRL